MNQNKWTSPPRQRKIANQAYSRVELPAMAGRRKRAEDKAERVLVIAKNLMRFRKERKLTAREAAGLSGRRLDTLRGWEHAKRAIDATDLYEFAKLYGRKMEDFYQENPPPPMPHVFGVFILERVESAWVDEKLWKETKAFVDRKNAEHVILVKQRIEKGLPVDGASENPKPTKPKKKQ
jgi:transcriptional regulator with XRE-family HTH domain